MEKFLGLMMRAEMEADLSDTEVESQTHHETAQSERNAFMQNVLEELEKVLAD